MQANMLPPVLITLAVAFGDRDQARRELLATREGRQALLAHAEKVSRSRSWGVRPNGEIPASWENHGDGVGSLRLRGEDGMDGVAIVAIVDGWAVEL